MFFDDLRLAQILLFEDIIIESKKFKAYLVLPLLSRHFPSCSRTIYNSEDTQRVKASVASW